MSPDAADRVAAAPPWARAVTEDRRILVHNVTWEQYVTVRDALEHHPGLHMTYLEGALEIMSPGWEHEGIKTMVARLLETWGTEVGVDIYGAGEWTLRKQARARGLEPDECYCVGRWKDLPDIAIEVIVTSHLLDKLDVYRGLGISEVWVWSDGSLRVHRLVGDRYEIVPRSVLLPQLDLELLVRYVRPAEQPQAVREYRDDLRAQS